MKPTDVTISPFASADAEAFAALNLTSLVGHGLLEPAGEKQLYNPQEHVFAHAGEIFIAS
ncbi:MAG TPA: hypothetical protein VJ813_11210 [Vicinamibacterales bacterium]|nr:hypothetical protein [Vicinamibacterales bacterium]